MKHHDQKSSWGGKGLFSLYFHIAVHHWKKSGEEFIQRRSLEAGADVEAMEGCCLLAYSACFPWLFWGTAQARDVSLKTIPRWL